MVGAHFRFVFNNLKTLNENLNLLECIVFCLSCPDFGNCSRSRVLSEGARKRKANGIAADFNIWHCRWVFEIFFHVVLIKRILTPSIVFKRNCRLRSTCTDCLFYKQKGLHQKNKFVNAFFSILIIIEVEIMKIKLFHHIEPQVPSNKAWPFKYPRFPTVFDTLPSQYSGIFRKTYIDPTVQCDNRQVQAVYLKSLQQFGHPSLSLNMSSATAVTSDTSLSEDADFKNYNKIFTMYN
jgi:hypothetical protein